MTVLIWQFDKEGKTTGKCDKRCYDSVKPVCDCICDGINHGVGLWKAVERTATHFKDHKGEDGRIVAARVRQYCLEYPDDNPI